MAELLHYVLDDEGNPIPEDDTRRWAAELDNIKRRRVALTLFSNGPKISTVFIGINYGSAEKPQLFETLIEGRKALPDGTERWATWADALEGHRAAVREAIDQGCTVKKNEEWSKPTVARKSQWERLTDDDDL